MGERTVKDSKNIDRKPLTPPIHSDADAHEKEEGMPLTLGGGGYGGTSQTTDPTDGKRTSSSES